jgi:hypothetical protein
MEVEMWGGWRKVLWAGATAGLLAASPLVLDGCKKFPDLGNIKDYLPKVRFDRMRVDRVDFQKIDASFDFDVQNPYPVDMRLLSFAWDLDLEGSDFLTGRSDEGLALAKKDTVKVSMPATLRFADIVSTVGNLKDRDDVGFRIAGDFGVNTPLGKVDVPFDQSGRIPVLKVPKIEPKAIRVAELKPLQNRATLELDLGVTNNAKSDAYQMKDFGYAVKLGGKEVVSGALAQLSVEAGSTATRTIPIELNLLQLGAQVVTAIQQKKPVDVGFAAGLKVQTPLGPIPLDVDEVTSLRIQ